MEISLATIYGLLLAVGLVSVDTVLNANTLFLDASVAKKFEDAGYTSEVVEQHMINQLAIIADTKSLVKAPVVKSSDAPSFSAALASVVSLQDSLEAAQQLVGFAPPKLYAAAVEHGETDTIELSGRSPLFGRFSISVDGAERKIDQMIEEAAYRTYRELDPYTALLFRVTQNSDNLPSVEPELDETLARVRMSAHADTRAQLENLKGIIALDRNDIEGAVKLFEKALKDDPHFHVVRLNLALAMVQMDRYDEAIAHTSLISEPAYWPMTGDPVMLSAAYVLRAVANWGKGNLMAAKGDLEYAVYLQPTSTAAYWYLSGVLHAMGEPDKGDVMLQEAIENLVYFETYPEIALLYFWISADDTRPLERRTSTLPTWHDQSKLGGTEKPTQTAPDAAPPAPTPSQSPSQSST
ncbi:MAG: tetratricopeptide repeat protein [Thalassobaculaceae bacterium]|nr:tetratricopeptide repeat protein [Thalassobaculaceae bacterium]